MDERIRETIARLFPADKLAAGLTADQIARLKDMIELAVGKAYFTGYEDGYRQAIEFKPEYGFPGNDDKAALVDGDGRRIYGAGIPDGRYRLVPVETPKERRNEGG